MLGFSQDLSQHQATQAIFSSNRKALLSRCFHQVIHLSKTINQPSSHTAQRPFKPPPYYSIHPLTTHSHLTSQHHASIRRHPFRPLPPLRLHSPQRRENPRKPPKRPLQYSDKPVERGVVNRQQPCTRPCAGPRSDPR